MNTPQPTTVPALGLPRTSMDELMLAMDIVDTLRHEQSLIERELASEQRDDAFIERVQQIYASQGIEVSDALVRQGVEALKHDRFAYTPPERTLQVRLAEVWVDRWRWLKRSLIAAGVALAGTLIVVVPNRFLAQRDYAAYVDSVQSLQQRAQRLSSQFGNLSVFPRGWAVDAPRSVAPHLAGLGAELARAQSDSVPQLASTGALSPADGDQFAADPEAQYAQLAPVRDGLDVVQQRLSAVEQRVKAGERLMLAAHRFEAAAARLGTIAVAEGAAMKIAETRDRASAALAAADDTAAAGAVAQFEQFVTLLDLSYTLRIVNRSNVQSGVWRYHEDAPGGKNYYLVVEPMDANGNAVTLPVTNEETQRTETVSLFAVRVPQSEYERVKADKIDNGLIDDAVVGEKRRGEIDVEYRVAVAGGAITEW